MREFAEALLLCGSALVIHGFSFVGIVMGFRILPARLEWFAEQAGWIPMAGWQRWANIVVAAGFAALATGLMVAALAEAPPMNVVAATELALAATWLAYLVTRARGGRSQ